MDLFRETLTTLSTIYSGFSGTTIASVAHCLWCAVALRLDALHQGGHRALLSFLYYFLGAYGSGTLSALVFMRPDVAPIPAFRDPRLLPLAAAAWYVVNYTRLGDWPMSKLLPLRLLCRLSTTLSRSSRICTNTALAVALYPGVHGAHLVMGTIGGVGSTLLCDAIKATLGMQTKPAELSAPGWSMRSGFLGSAVFLIAVYHLPEALRLEAEQAKALVVTVCLVHAAFGTLRGADSDFTAPCGAAFHALSGIPPPPPVATPHRKPEKGRAPKAAEPAVNGTPPPVRRSQRLSQKAD
eukprot:jgi/Tetstr1/432954/TSEL_022292.t1